MYIFLICFPLCFLSGQNNARVAVCRGCILVGPSRFSSFFFFLFLQGKNDPCVVARSRLAPVPPVARVHTCAKPMLVNYFVWFQSLFQVLKQTNLELFLIRQVYYLGEKMLGVEFQRLLWATNMVDCRWSLSAYRGQTKFTRHHLSCHWFFFLLNRELVLIEVQFKSF